MDFNVLFGPRRQILLPSRKYRTKGDRRYLQRIVWNCSHIPTIANCDIISLGYTLRIEANIPWALDAVINIPFTLGNVPSQSSAGQPPLPPIQYPSFSANEFVPYNPNPAQALSPGSPPGPPYQGPPPGAPYPGAPYQAPPPGVPPAGGPFQVPPPGAYPPGPPKLVSN